tara:strand:+ start:1916 stop:2092 length:177 start_codon:yes stop_codon:yes gene_type:complete
MRAFQAFLFEKGFFIACVKAKNMLFYCFKILQKSQKGVSSEINCASNTRTIKFARYSY